MSSWIAAPTRKDGVKLKANVKAPRTTSPAPSMMRGPVRSVRNPNAAFENT